MADRSPAALRDALRVYLVTPDAWGTRAEDVTITEGLLRAGLRVVQFRDKSAAPRQRERAQQLQALCHAHGDLFLVNDDPNLDNSFFFSFSLLFAVKYYFCSNHIFPVFFYLFYSMF